MYFIPYNNLNILTRLIEINNFCSQNIWLDNLTNNYSSIYYLNDTNQYGVPFLEGYESAFTIDELNSIIWTDNYDIIF